MSVQAISWVLEHSEARLGARLVLLAIANHADDAGENSWSAVKRLARVARMSERQTRYALRQLEADGEVERVGRSHRGTNVYRLPGMAVSVLPGVGADIAPADSAGGQEAAPGGQNPAPTHEEPAPEPSLEPSLEPSSGKVASLRPKSDPIWDGFAAWLGRIPQTKSERGAWNAAVKQLRDIGVDNTADIIRRGRLYQQRYPGAAGTPNALVAHWSEFGSSAPTSRRSDPRTDPDGAYIDEMKKARGIGG